MIRLATLEDLNRIKEITEACAVFMESKGIFQWNVSYPSREVFEADINKKELYVYVGKDQQSNVSSLLQVENIDDKVSDSDELLGCMVISEEKDEVYANVCWPSMRIQPSPSFNEEPSSDKNKVDEDNIHCFYIHRLAVHPSFQGKGIGQKLMEYAETYGRATGYISIRLDTFSLNERNQRFYSSLGYKKLDESNNVYFPNQSGDPFYCFEKLL